MIGFGDHKKSESKIRKYKFKNNSSKQIINQAIRLHVKGDIPEALKFYQRIINVTMELLDR